MITSLIILSLFPGLQTRIFKGAFPRASLFTYRVSRLSCSGQAELDIMTTLKHLDLLHSKEIIGRNNDIRT
jgi:hypothetical protein